MTSEKCRETSLVVGTCLTARIICTHDAVRASIAGVLDDIQVAVLMQSGLDGPGISATVAAAVLR